MTLTKGIKERTEGHRKDDEGRKEGRNHPLEGGGGGVFKVVGSGSDNSGSDGGWW
jgi:hypothetical protein